MKKIVRLCATLAVALSINSAVYSAELEFPWGSVAALEKYCVTNANEFWMDTFQPFFDDFITFTATTEMYDLTTIEEIQALFQTRLRQAAEMCLTNVFTDKDEPIGIFALTTKHYEHGNVDMLVLFSEFRLKKISENQYIIPDLSEVKLFINSRLHFHVPPGIKWGRIEYNRPGETDAFYTSDTRTNPDPYTSGIYTDPGFPFIWLHRDVLMAVTNGPSRMKVMFLTDKNEYMAFDGTGKRAETPVRLKLENRPLANLHGFDPVLKGIIYGGDPGRQFSVEKAPSPLGPWQSTGLSIQIFTYRDAQRIELPYDRDIGFFRLNNNHQSIPW